METQFYILLSLKTPEGYENYGQIFFGNDREGAYHLFGQLQGKEEIVAHRPLHIDLMETVDSLPVRIRTVCCTLDDLACNTKLIAREIFRLKNLKAYEE